MKNIFATNCFVMFFVMDIEYIYIYHHVYMCVEFVLRFIRRRPGMLKLFQINNGTFIKQLSSEKNHRLN